VNICNGGVIIMHIEILDLIEGARQARRLANAKDADELIPGSFVNAEAIVAYIKKKAPEKVSLVCMGTWAVKPNDNDKTIKSI
jgi:phosphosulfolactate phosphohydrolase-like enzyme